MMKVAGAAAARSSAETNAHPFFSIVGKLNCPSIVPLSVASHD